MMNGLHDEKQVSAGQIVKISHTHYAFHENQFLKVQELMRSDGCIER
jgi:hypothetical protein